MIRRRKFLKSYTNSNLTYFKKDIIRDNLYYINFYNNLSSNNRFFWKKIYHTNKYYSFFKPFRTFSSYYRFCKLFLFNFLFNTFSCVFNPKYLIFFNKNYFFSKLYLKKILKTFFFKNTKTKFIFNTSQSVLFNNLLNWNLNFYIIFKNLLLKFILFLEKKLFFNNGVHTSYVIRRELPVNFKTSIFNILKKKNRNKSIKKKLLSRSIEPIKKKLIFKKVFLFNTCKLLKYLIQFIFNSFSKKILSLFCCSNGFFFIKNATSIHYLFRFYKNFSNFKKKMFRIKKDSYFLYKLKRLDNFCSFNFIFNKKQKYATAIGSKAILVKIDKAKKIGFVKMPSKKVKLISLFSLVLKGRIKCFSNKKLIETKASYLRLRGKKSNSRGVAMNPIDHPHGGNTNSIKLHKTPWGKPTKKK